MTLGPLLAEQMEGTRDWTLRLLADFHASDWGFQPRPGLQHALWISGHLAFAQNALLFKRCLNRDELDAAFASHFPIGGPVPSLTEHAYPPVEVVRREMDRMQEITLRTLVELPDTKLAEPAFGGDGKPHPHYSTVRGAISHIIRHEAFHAGQLAMLRRMMGKSFLR